MEQAAQVGEWKPVDFVRHNRTGDIDGQDIEIANGGNRRMSMCSIESEIDEFRRFELELLGHALSDTNEKARHRRVVDQLELEGEEREHVLDIAAHYSHGSFRDEEKLERREELYKKLGPDGIFTTMMTGFDALIRGVTEQECTPPGTTTTTDDLAAFVMAQGLDNSVGTDCSDLLAFRLSQGAPMTPTRHAPLGTFELPYET